MILKDFFCFYIRAIRVDSRTISRNNLIIRIVINNSLNMKFLANYFKNPGRRFPERLHLESCA